jgi:hypothetical protein
MVNEHTLVDACHLQFAEMVVRIDQQRVAAEATHGRVVAAPSRPSAR